MDPMRTIEDQMLHPWTFEARCNHKPLSVNAAYYRNKKKTKAYEEYEDAWRSVLLGDALPEDIEVKSMFFSVEYEWGFSNVQADVDNPIKTTTDIMQRHFVFNDKQIRIVKATKRLVPKGQEYAKVKITQVFKEDLDAMERL